MVKAVRIERATNTFAQLTSLVLDEISSTADTPSSTEELKNSSASPEKKTPMMERTINMETIIILADVSIPLL